MPLSSVTRKKSPKVYKSWPKMISIKMIRFSHLYKNCLRMWEIWANKLLPKAVKVAQSPINRPIWSHCPLVNIVKVIYLGCLCLHSSPSAHLPPLVRMNRGAAQKKLHFSFSLSKTSFLISHILPRDGCLLLFLALVLLLGKDYSSV